MATPASTPGKGILVAAVALVLFAVACFVAVALATRAQPSAAAGPARAAAAAPPPQQRFEPPPAPPPSRPLPPREAVAATAAAMPSRAAYAAEHASAPAAPRRAAAAQGKVAWDAIPLATGSGRSLVEAVAAVLPDELPATPENEACPDPGLVAQLKARPRIARRPGSELDPRRGTLVLQLEVVAPNRARVVDAPLEKQGRASEALVTCARLALRGRTLTLPGLQPGERLRMRYPL